MAPESLKTGCWRVKQRGGETKPLRVWGRNEAVLEEKK